MDKYSGTLTTQALPDATEHNALNRLLFSTLLSTFRMIGKKPNYLDIGPNNSIRFNEMTMPDRCPNPFLPESDWDPENYTSFDNVVSYIVYTMKEHGYFYSGQIVASNGDRLWKLEVRNGEVYRTEGRMAIVYDEASEYQVGGVSL